MSVKDDLAWAEYESYCRGKELVWAGAISPETFKELWPDMPPNPRGHDEYLKAKWPNGDRLMLAWRLAGDLATLEDLLLGHHVDPIRLDEEWLRWAKREKFVALKPAIEVLDA